MVPRWFIVNTLAFAILLAQNAWCVAPTLANILPRGGARGTEVEVRFVGSKLGDSVDLIFHDPGITLVEMKEAAGDHATCVLRIAPDCRVGAHAIRVRTLTGASNLRLFSVGTLTEVSETEPNNDPATAQRVELGTTVNGIVTNEDVDYFAVDLNEGDSIAVEIEALRLGTTLFDPKLRLFGPQGHELLAEDDTALMKQDAAFVHTAHKSGRYLVAVTEASYGGSAASHYRLHIGAFPRPLAVTPMGGLPGTATQLRWLGDPALETSEVVLPEGEPGLKTIEVSNAAGIAPTPMPFLLSEWPGVMESEPNDTRENATAGTAPGAFDGVVQEDGDVDWYRFEGRKGQVFRIRVWARALGSPLDSVMTLVGPSGSEVVSDDDGAGMDSTARVTLPEDGTYFISVRDHLQRGGATFSYRVHVGPIKQRLTLSLPDVKAASMVVARGNRNVFVLGATRRNFDGPLSIEFADLPAGVTAEYGVIPAGQTRIPVLFTAASDAAPIAALTRVEGTWTKDAISVTGRFRQGIPLVLGRNDVVFHEYTVDRLAMAVADTAPYSIEAVVPEVPIVYNGNMDLRIIASRSEGFTAPIELKFPWLPVGFGGGTGTIKEGETEAVMRVEARRAARVGEHKLIVLGESGGYAVSTSFVPIHVSERWVAFTLEETQSEQGKAFEWVARTQVNHPFEGAHRVELRRLPKGVTSEPQTFTAETTEIRFPIKVAADAATGNHKSIGMMTVIDEGKGPIRHGFGGAPLKIYAPLPPKLQKPDPPPEQNTPEPDKPKRRTRFPEAQ